MRENWAICQSIMTRTHKYTVQKVEWNGDFNKNNCMYSHNKLKSDLILWQSYFL